MKLRLPDRDALFGRDVHPVVFAKTVGLYKFIKLGVDCIDPLIIVWMGISDIAAFSYEGHLLSP